MDRPHNYTSLVPLTLDPGPPAKGVAAHSFWIGRGCKGLRSHLGFEDWWVWAMSCLGRQGLENHGWLIALSGPGPLNSLLAGVAELSWGGGEGGSKQPLAGVVILTVRVILARPREGRIG